MDEGKVLTVSELTQKIANLLQSELGFVTVRGEVSNYKLHSSGHRYFTLKDAEAQVNCVFWRSKFLNFELSDGLNVIVSGWLTVYSARGQYQIDCELIQPIGLGDLYLQFEALKRKLSEEGLFEISRKRTIPFLPLRIGIATSSTGAAIQDILTTINRRNPLCTVYFRETLVQGEEAKFDIVEAIKELNQLPLDLIILGRGGGSIEDLWAFNEEIVARAIFNSKVPIISAVGHETDFTIADFVADRRAPTPTAAAEMATPLTIDMLSEQIVLLKESLIEHIQEGLEERKKEIRNLVLSYGFRKIEDKIRYFKQYSDELEERFQLVLKNYFDRLKEKLENLERNIQILNPFNPLGKGYALLKHKGKIIDKYVSLGRFRNVEIVREDEVAKAQLLDVKPRLPF